MARRITWHGGVYEKKMFGAMDMMYVVGTAGWLRMLSYIPIQFSIGDEWRKMEHVHP